MAQDILLKSLEGEILIRDGIVFGMGSNLSIIEPGTRVIDTSNLLITQGFTDLHVHFREPGYSYKETIGSGSRAAARGGYTTVCTMPNLKPVPDSPENIKIQQDIIDRDAVIEVLPYSSITRDRAGKELVDFKAMKPLCCAFSDDGSGVQNEKIMEEAMMRAAESDCIIAAHCEDNSLLHGGYIHKGRYAESHNHKGICSESEWGQIARDLRLAEKTGARYHVCHISCAESVELIREAKARGVRVTCETAPHYLVLCEDELQEEGRFKMNPPLRSAKDRDALVEGLKDGTIDAIATDHAPHSAEEKARGLEFSAMGITGLETAFPVLYTYLVKSGKISLERIIEALSEGPRRIFGLPENKMEPGSKADLCLIDLDAEYRINSADFLSKGHATPFDGHELCGRIIMTIKDGKVVHEI